MAAFGAVGNSNMGTLTISAIHVMVYIAKIAAPIGIVLWNMLCVPDFSATPTCAGIPIMPFE
jgi:hypothetical protein